MKLWIVFTKTLREMLREPWMLGLSLAFAPFFVFLYWLFTMGGSTSYTVVVIDHDRGYTLADGRRLEAGAGVIAALNDVRYSDGSQLLKTRQVASRAEAETILRNRGGVAFVELPDDFSQKVAALQAGDRSPAGEVIFGGDLTNPYYTVGGVLALGAVDSYVMDATGQQPLVRYTEQALGTSAARTEFEVYVPGILVFAVTMMIFLAAMSVAREIEAGTLRRVQLTPTSAFDFIGGITLAQVLMGVLAVGMTFATAVALGFRSQGSLWVAVLVGALCNLSVVGMGMVVASFTRTVSQAFVVANFPLGLLMFFSGSIFPIPKPAWFSLGGHALGPYDLLPATHAVVALNKVLTLGAGLGEVWFELAALVVLSVVYFAAGVWLFQRMHLN